MDKTTPHRYRAHASGEEHDWDRTITGGYLCYTCGRLREESGGRWVVKRKGVTA